MPQAAMLSSASGSYKYLETTGRMQLAGQTLNIALLSFDAIVYRKQPRAASESAFPLKKSCLGHAASSYAVGYLNTKLIALNIITNVLG